MVLETNELPASLLLLLLLLLLVLLLLLLLPPCLCRSKSFWPLIL